MSSSSAEKERSESERDKAKRRDRDRHSSSSSSRSDRDRSEKDRNRSEKDRDRKRDRDKDKESSSSRRDRERDRKKSSSSSSADNGRNDSSSSKSSSTSSAKKSSSSSSSSKRDRDKERSSGDKDRDRKRGRSDRDRDRDHRSRRDRDKDGDIDMTKDDNEEDKDGFKKPKNKSNGAQVGEKRKALSAQFGELTAIAKKAKKSKDLSKGVVKPVFLTKKQRQELALKELAAKRKAEREKQDAMRKAHRDLEREAQNAANDFGGRRGINGVGGIPSRFMSERARTREREERQKSREERNKERESKKKEEAVEKMTQNIKASYLGQKKRKKRIIPKNGRFSFDWEPSDDTSQELHPLYQKKADLSMAFGRGFVAGVDRDSQKKKQTVYDDLVKKHKIDDEELRKQIEQRKKEREAKEEASKEVKRKANRHWKQKTLSEMTSRDWRIFREDYNISTRGGANLPHPLRSWRESKLSKPILEVLKDIGYQHPTPVQRMAIPIGMDNRDIVGIAETGSGKTCAFMLPMMMYIQNLPKMTSEVAADGPYAIVLAPSRELAQQIEDECKPFAERLGIRTAPIVGGADIVKQSYMLREGAEIVIATPGRMIDCIERRFTVLNQCNYVVLDEADRMMEMGFQEQVNAILDKMPSSNLRPENPEEEKADHQYRQTFMFSATMPQQVEFITKKFQRNPAYIAIGKREGASAKRVKQNVIFVTSQNQKRKELRSILDRARPPNMIFCNQKSECDNLWRFLNEHNYKADVLHGGKQQDVREYALKSIKDGEIDSLICTNVAGRGIHIEGVTHVINYDMPTSIEEYTHRIGRTGRAGREGEATSFLTPSDSEVYYDLKNLLVASGNTVPHDLARHPASQAKPGTPGARVRPKVVFAKK